MLENLIALPTAFGDLAREFPQGIFPLAAGVRIRARAVAQYSTFAGLFWSGCGIISLQSLSPASLVDPPWGEVLFLSVVIAIKHLSFFYVALI